MKKLVVTICSSANFYKKVVEIQGLLEKHGFKTIIPHTAEKMKISGDFDASHYRTWLVDDKDYHKKSALMRGHFDEIENSDVVLVVNEKKHSVENYIGGNVFIEMGLAFYLHKPIYILNDIPKQSSFLEEIIGMQPVVLKSNIRKLVELLTAR